MRTSATTKEACAYSSLRPGKKRSSGDNASIAEVWIMQRECDNQVAASGWRQAVAAYIVHIMSTKIHPGGPVPPAVLDDGLFPLSAEAAYRDGTGDAIADDSRLCTHRTKGAWG